MGREEVCFAPVLDVAEVFQNEHVVSRKMFLQPRLPNYGKTSQLGFGIKLAENPAAIKSPPPQYGEHTEKILREVGYGSSEIADLIQKRVVYQHQKEAER